ncbi:MAG: hypothetical protein ACLPID_11280 [Beijerinckiaceae bacterium]
MRPFNELKKRWDDDAGRRPYRFAIVMTDAGLVLGADTILARMGVTRSGEKSLAIDADRERSFALLGVAYWCRIPRDIVKNFENAAEQWRRGEKVLAQIHLAFARLPRLENAIDVYRLYLAGSLLDEGLPPGKMLMELGLDRTRRQLVKFDPNQPRLPAGSGQQSGQWTKQEESSASSSGASASTPGAPASTSGADDHKVELAGDVIHVGFLVGWSISRVPGEIPITTCRYESLFGDFEVRTLGIVTCKFMHTR